MREFDHERLEVYRKAIEFVLIAADAIAQLPKGRGTYTDQLERSSTSIVLNIAEGAGEFAPKEKARLYRLARRSATESAAVLEVCASLALIRQETYQKGREKLLEVVSMLVGLIRKLGDRGALRQDEEGKGRGMGKGRGEV